MMKDSARGVAEFLSLRNLMAWAFKADWSSSSTSLNTEDSPVRRVMVTIPRDQMSTAEVCFSLLQSSLCC